MNDDGDIQLVDDMELFSQHEMDSYRRDDNELSIQASYKLDQNETQQTIDHRQDSQRFRLMPPPRKTVHFEDQKPIYQDSGPLSLQIKPKLQQKQKEPAFASSLQPINKKRPPPPKAYPKDPYMPKSLQTLGSLRHVCMADVEKDEASYRES